MPPNNRALVWAPESEQDLRFLPLWGRCGPLARRIPGGRLSDSLRAWRVLE
jgi:hypothetical protein